MLAKNCGVKIVEINLQASSFTLIADVFLQGPATEMVGALVKELVDGWKMKMQ